NGEGIQLHHDRCERVAGYSASETAQNRGIANRPSAVPMARPGLSETSRIVMTTPKRFYGKGIPGVDVEQLKGQLIVVEGADGSGRSTQMNLLRNWLERRGYPTVNVGLKRSMLVSRELEQAMQGNILGTRTL